MRPCQTHCKHGHPLSGDNLYLSPKGSRGCKKCRSKYAHDSHKSNPQKMRSYRKTWYEKHPGYDRERYYGITNQEFLAKAEKQKHLCMICKRLMESPRVDHNHETNEVRDLLCNTCNVAVGMVREDILIAKSLVAYLEKWGS